MKMLRCAFALASLAVVAGCQTNYTYTRIGPGPTMEYAQAQCQMYAPMVDQGYIAFGSSSYVAGAAIGNAIGNAVREDQFIKQCMVLQGWKRIPLPTSHSSHPALNRARQQAIEANRHKTGYFPPPPK